MKHRWHRLAGAALLAGMVLPTRLGAQAERGPYARIAILRPNDGDTVDFEATLSAGQAALQGEPLWYRMAAGGAIPRYVRLRPRSSLSAALEGSNEQALPDEANDLVTKTSVEILNLRPTLCLGVSPALQ